MKVLFDHALPFQLAHGGVQTQILRTKAALGAAGVEVGFLRWWDEAQEGDLIHLFSPVRGEYLDLARQKGRPVVLTSILSETCNRPRWRLRLQGLVVRTILRVPVGRGIQGQLNWQAYARCTHHVVGLAAEQAVLQIVYGVPARRISVVPLGLDEAFLAAGPGRRDAPHLVCVSTITPIKGVVELAQLAREARVPVLFVGKPYDANSAYARAFRELVDGRHVMHHPHVGTAGEMIALLHAARGFVLRSRFENWCLAASEAAACGLPLLLPDLPWSRERFGDAAWYWTGHRRRDVERLRRFHRECPSLRAPAAARCGWTGVAERLRAVYTAVLASSR
ncbi:MAG: glycosyltransferase family 4 protein [Verrucomicrobia bacterium]|nr:glycosyltransferase family 4 protein [Verrucomicrobiota bacterium]